MLSLVYLSVGSPWLRLTKKTSASNNAPSFVLKINWASLVYSKQGFVTVSLYWAHVPLLNLN